MTQSEAMAGRTMTEQPEQREHSVPGSQAEAHSIASATSGLELPPCASNRRDFQQQLIGADVSIIACWAGHAPEVWQRHMAFEILTQTIQEIARKIHRRSARHIHYDDFEADAISHIGDNISKFHPNSGKFRNWCAVVLKNLARTTERQEIRFALLRRHFKKSRSEPTSRNRKSVLDIDAGSIANNQNSKDTRPDTKDAGLSVMDAPSGLKHEHIDLLKTSLKDLRDALSTISWGTLRGVNYPAVVLLQLRLAMAKLVAGTIEHVARSAVLELFLPWLDDEKDMSFRTGWPTLELIWEGLCPRLDEPPNYVDVGALCAIVNDLPPPTMRLNEALWNQWVKRAKEKLKQQLEGTNRWTPLLTALFPDRS